MKAKRKITEHDYLLVNRRVIREEEIRAHGKQIAFRNIAHKVKKAYNRRKLKEFLKKEIDGEI